MQAPELTYSHTLADQLRRALRDRAPTADAVDGACPAGVLIPLRYHHGRWHVIFNLRSQTVGQHKGEIAFPGGRLEPEDEHMLACALRETEEEMGVCSSDVDVLGHLDAVLTRTNFLVWPIVGVLPYPYDFTVDEREVAEVIELPLDELLDDGVVRHEARLLHDGSLLRRPSYSSNGYLIFGATAWMLEQFLSIVRTTTGHWTRTGLKEAHS